MKFIRQNKIFLALYLVFLVVGGIMLLILNKGDETLYLNSLHNGLADQIFKWTTRIAEGPALMLIIIVTLRFSYGKGLLLGVNNLLVFACIHIFKEYVFAGSPRPALFFEGKQALNFVQGVEILRHNSFPSGHTASAFAFFFMFSIVTTNKRWSFLFFTLALIVAISRLYLLEHFLTDVYFGSMVGVGITTIFYLTFAESDFYRNLKWKDKGLF